MDNSVSKHLKHNQGSHAGKKRGGSGAKGKKPSASGAKQKKPSTSGKEQETKIDARTDAVVKELGKQIGQERAESWRPTVRESLKVWLNPESRFGDMGKQLVINGKKLFIGVDEKPLNAQMVLDMVADSIGTSKLTGISEADFSSGAAFRNTVGKLLVSKANPYKDKGGRFTSREKAVAIVPQGLTASNAPTKLAGKMIEHGGFTFDPKKSQLRRKGFAVSTVKDAEAVVSAEEFKKSGEEIVKNYVKQHSEILSQPKMHLGGWHDKQSGKVFLDASKVVGSADEAANLGRKHDQIGFFDLATFTTYVRFPTSKGMKYLASGVQTVSNAPSLGPGFGEVPIVDISVVGKAQSVEGVILCPVDSLLDSASIRKFVEQVMASGVSKSEPTVSDVHLPTIMNNRKRRKKKIKKSELVAKKERLKDPKGGLTAAGRRHFNRTTGSNLKPGVRGKADTPEKMRRKGSFLTRFFTNPSGPMKDDKGRPTRLALSAAAWGEPVPSDRAAAARLAQKGRNLLERYERIKEKKVSKFNPNHDRLGRFTFTRSAGDGGGGNNPAYLPRTQADIDAQVVNRALKRGKDRAKGAEEAQKIIDSPETQPTPSSLANAMKRIKVKDGKVVWNVFDKKSMQESVAGAEQKVRDIATGKITPKSVEAKSKKQALEYASETLQETRSRLAAIIETERGQ